MSVSNGNTNSGNRPPRPAPGDRLVDIVPAEMHRVSPRTPCSSYCGGPLVHRTARQRHDSHTPPNDQTRPDRPDQTLGSIPGHSAHVCGAAKCPRRRRAACPASPARSCAPKPESLLPWPEAPRPCSKAGRTADDVSSSSVAAAAGREDLSSCLPSSVFILFSVPGGPEERCRAPWGVHEARRGVGVARV